MTGIRECARRVRNQTIVLTHPTHPLRGQKLAVLHFRPKENPPTLLVERPDLSVQVIPLSWTDRATPNQHQAAGPSEGRLSALALLELVRAMRAWREKP